MKMQKEFVKRIPVVREISLFILRIWTSAMYFVVPVREWFYWLFRSKENSNYTYDITELNRRYLASMVAAVTGKDYSEIALYLREIDTDESLRNHIQTAIRASGQKYMADLEVYYGRRIGWYAFVRATKPRIFIETGVEKGMGSCVLTAALMKNEMEDHSGYYYGTDIDPAAGYLFSGEYKKYGDILYGDSISSLGKLDCTVNLFINDSDHSEEYEEREYQSISGKLDSQAIILGDNSHSTDKLLNFALSTGRNFLFFREDPFRHWYPGAGIGVAYRHIRQ